MKNINKRLMNVNKKLHSTIEKLWPYMIEAQKGFYFTFSLA